MVKRLIIYVSFLTKALSNVAIPRKEAFKLALSSKLVLNNVRAVGPIFQRGDRLQTACKHLVAEENRSARPGPSLRYDHKCKQT